MPGTTSLLGCAFAVADLLFEIDAQHRVRLALGAAQRLTGRGPAEVSGADWRDWIHPDDRTDAEALVRGIVPGERRGPVAVRLALQGDGGVRTASLAAFLVPELAPNVSCALTLGAPVRSDVALGVRALGLHDRESFLAHARALNEAASRDGLELDVALIDIGLIAPDLPRARRDGEVATTLKAESYGGISAGDFDHGRYAVLRRAGEPDGVVARLADAARRPEGAVAQAFAAIRLDPKLAPSVNMRALRMVLEQFESQGLAGGANALIETFVRQASETNAQAQAFSRMIYNRDFRLHFQPIVSLRTGEVHHYEALARFTGAESPFEMIKMAEELDIIERFDLATAQAAMTELARQPQVTIAVNVSGRSLMRRAFVERLLETASKHPAGARLSVEITESAALGDLDLANAHVQALRKAGIKVALDDFGAGAASFAYLRALTIDSVKIDGQYVRELSDGARDATLIRHLVQLCRELNVQTVAEMVETREVAEQLKALGVDYGQGWLYGRPSLAAAPQAPPPSPGLRARRQGAVESWG